MDWKFVLPYGSFVLICIAAEFICSYKRNWSNYNWKEALSSIAIKYMEMGANTLYLFAFAPVFNWAYQNRIYTIDLNPLFVPIVYFFIVELHYYVTHRFAHSTAIGWTNHITHHSFTKMNFINGTRLGITTPFALYYFSVIPLFILGVEPKLFAIFMYFGLLYQVILHTELVTKLGPLEHILNTPSNHRVHHGTQAEYKNKNYGLVTVLFDRLFNTYQPEVDEIKPTYGLIGGLPSQNPLRLSFLGWEQLIRERLNRPLK